MRRKGSVLFGAALATLAAAGPAWAQEAEGGGGGSGIVAFLVSLVLAVIGLLISLGLAMWAVKVAISMFDRWTKGIDEWAEIKKGNVAVAILLVAVIVAIANVISGGVAGLTGALHGDNLKQIVVGVVVGVINLLVGLGIATFTVNLALKVLDKVTKEVDEVAEIAKGNVAVAVIAGGALVAVSVVIRSGVEGISRILDAGRLANALGL